MARTFTLLPGLLGKYLPPKLLLQPFPLEDPTGELPKLGYTEHSREGHNSSGRLVDAAFLTEKRLTLEQVREQAFANLAREKIVWDTVKRGRGALKLGARWLLAQGDGATALPLVPSVMMRLHEQLGAPRLAVAMPSYRRMHAVSADDRELVSELMGSVRYDYDLDTAGVSPFVFAVEGGRVVGVIGKQLGKAESAKLAAQLAGEVRAGWQAPISGRGLATDWPTVVAQAPQRLPIELARIDELITRSASDPAFPLGEYVWDAVDVYTSLAVLGDGGQAGARTERLVALVEPRVATLTQQFDETERDQIALGCLSLIGLAAALGRAIPASITAWEPRLRAFALTMTEAEGWAEARRVRMACCMLGGGRGADVSTILGPLSAPWEAGQTFGPRTIETLRYLGEAVATKRTGWAPGFRDYATQFPGKLASGVLTWIDLFEAYRGLHVHVRAQPVATTISDLQAILARL